MSLFRRTAVLAAALAAVTSLPAPAQQASLAGLVLGAIGVAVMWLRTQTTTPVGTK